MINQLASSKVNAEPRRDTMAECRKMKADLATGKFDKSGKPTGANSLTATGATQLSSQASCAPSAAGSMASTIPMQQILSVYFPSPVGSQAPQQTETWFINMIGPAQRSLMVASLDGAEYALLDSGSGLTSCPINLTTFHYCRGPTTFRP